MKVNMCYIYGNERGRVLWNEDMELSPWESRLQEWQVMWGEWPGTREDSQWHSYLGISLDPAGKQKAATYYVFLGCPASFDAQAISTLPEAGNVTDVLECPGKGVVQLFIPGWKSILGRGGPLHCRVAEEPQHGLKTRMVWTCELRMWGTTSECEK